MNHHGGVKPWDPSNTTLPTAKMHGLGENETCMKNESRLQHILLQNTCAAT